jgi:glycosyltransferase involved in cell wall biosynthesis
LDIAAVLPLALRLALAPEVFVGSRRKVVRSLLRLLAVSPHALAGRQKSRAIFPFRAWDYELTREGGFVRYTDSRSSEPLVSVITRTYRGREVFLKQALLSVAHQTYPNVEHIVVEDGGDTMRAAINNVEQATGSLVRFIGLEKCGRAVAANAGLAAARGRWCLFLDDDDLLFADHLDVLTSALLAEPSAVAAYSLAWEVATDKAKSADGTYRELTHRVPSVLRQPFDSDVLMHHNFMPIQSVLFKRELFETRGGVDEDMDVLEDWLLWLRYARGNHFVYVPKVTSIYRVPADPQETRKREDTFGAAYPLARARAHGALFNRERRRVAYASGEVFTGCVQSSEEDTPAGTMAER